MSTHMLNLVERNVRQGPSRNESKRRFVDNKLERRRKIAFKMQKSNRFEPGDDDQNDY